MVILILSIHLLIMGPSQEDRLSLDLVNDGKGQSKQYVFHNGLRTTIYRGTDSSADVTIQAND